MAMRIACMCILRRILEGTLLKCKSGCIACVETVALWEDEDPNPYGFIGGLKMMIRIPTNL